MLTNNLFKILEHFSRKEMTYFLEFIQSPYFNKHDQVINLVSYLSEIYPKFDEVTCSKSRLWKEIFKKGKQDASKLSLVFTYTNRLMDKFLAFQMLEENQETLDLWTIRHLRRKKLFNPCQKKISKLEEAVEDKTLRDSQYLQFSNSPGRRVRPCNCRTGENCPRIPILKTNKPIWNNTSSQKK
ncbi:MAG: hypothetical protein R2879_03755 [Saprospiraceae bacterium]